jgi:nucleoside-diphosphate-sugar epimerase
VYGDGQQTRSFQYVSDLVAGLVKLMEGEHTGPFNIGACSPSPNQTCGARLQQPPGSSCDVRVTNRTDSGGR